MGEEIDAIESDDIDPVLVATDDVAAAPNELGDPPGIVRGKLPAHILDKFDVYSYRNAAVILAETHKAEFDEILGALETFEITTRDIRMPGGNESRIPKIFSAALRPLGWFETIISANLHVTLAWAEEEQTGAQRKFRPSKKIKCERSFVRERYLDGHKIDYVKGRIAFDVEWNSKDQTFDRDLYAFSAFANCGAVDAAILVTRSEDLNVIFRALGPALKKDGTQSQKSTISKYGASTTWMGKLLYRLNAGRNGGCPVLAVGIGPKCISDWRAF